MKLELKSKNGTTRVMSIPFWVCDVMRPLISMKDIFRNNGEVSWSKDKANLRIGNVDISLQVKGDISPYIEGTAGPGETIQEVVVQNDQVVKTTNPGKSKTDYWILKQTSVIRVHKCPRKIFYNPEKSTAKDCPVELKSIDSIDDNLIWGKIKDSTG